VDRLIDRRHLQAYLIMVAGGLIRPEWWPFLGLYAIWLWFREPAFKSPGMRLVLLAGLAVQPVGWFVPPWVTTGQPFLAATHAADYNGHLGSNVLRSILARGVRDQLLPALILAAVAVVVGWVRDRNRAILAIAAFIAGWWGSARRLMATRASSASSCPRPRSPRCSAAWAWPSWPGWPAGWPARCAVR